MLIWGISSGFMKAKHRPARFATTLPLQARSPTCATLANPTVSKIGRLHYSLSFVVRIKT
jgi:hypothetical protein